MTPLFNIMPFILRISLCGVESVIWVLAKVQKIVLICFFQPGDWQKGTCLWWRGSNNFFSSSILVPWEPPIAAKGIRLLHSVWIDQESNEINIDFTYVISLQNYLQMNGCIYAIGQSQTISFWLLKRGGSTIALLVKNAKLYDRVRGVYIFFHSLRDKFMTIAASWLKIMS